MVTLHQESLYRLWIRARPAYWAVGVVLGIAIAGLLTLAPHLVIHCTRSSAGPVTCEVHRQLFGIRFPSRTVYSVQFADLQEGDGTSRIILRTPTGPVPLSRSYTGWRAFHEKAVDELNAFFMAPEAQSKDATVTMGVSLWLWSAVAFLWLVAVRMAVGAWTRCLLDKETGQITVERPGLFGLKREHYALAEVERFAVRQKVQAGGDQDDSDDSLHYGDSGWVFLVLAVIFKNGREVTLAEQIFSGSPATDLVRKLEKFRKASLPSVLPAPDAIQKPCWICARECDGGPRLKDDLGRYYHPDCYSKRFGAFKT